MHVTRHPLMQQKKQVQNKQYSSTDQSQQFLLNSVKFASVNKP